MAINILSKTVFFAMVILAVFQVNVYSQQWSQVFSPTKYNLNNVFFIDTLSGWIGGDSGIIIHTSDNGMNWRIQNSGVTNPVYSVFFVDENTGYALSWNFDKTPPLHYGTRVLSTTNGGLNWSNYLFPDTNLFLNSICFFDEQNGCMGGTVGKIYYTTNAGQNWFRSTVDSGIASVFPVEKIKYSDRQNMYAAGGSFDIAGVIWKSTDAGRNWISTIVGPEPLNDIFIYNSSEVLCAGGDFEYGASNVYTSNSGANWRYTEFGIFGISRSIDFRTNDEGWIALGITDSFLVTTDRGISWELRPAPDGAQIYDIDFTNTRNGWAVGNDGVILKYNFEPSGISGDEELIPGSEMLYQNYPNPFNPSTVISYSLPEKSDIKLTIYNAIGIEIKTLINGSQNAGKHEIIFNAENNPSGIYYIKLISYKTGQYNSSKMQSITKKMLLLK